MPYVASHRHAPISPSKARLVADMIRGKSVDEALSALRLAPQRAARMLYKVVQSAQANAEDQGVNDVEGLYVARAYVDDAPRLKRWRPRSRGMASPILRRRSHLCVELDLRTE
jgi:large subunit ribosomal protein L22